MGFVAALAAWRDSAQWLAAQVAYLRGNRDFLAARLEALSPVTMALVEASEDRIGIPIRKALEFCFSYDPEGRTYVFNLARVVGTVMVMMVMVVVIMVMMVVTLPVMVVVVTVIVMMVGMATQIRAQNPNPVFPASATACSAHNF